MSFKGRDILAIDQFDKEEILHVLDQAAQLKQSGMPKALSGKILGSCFFEPSTRTRLSFETAMHRLGGSVVGFSNQNSTSVQKGESLSDTMQMMEHYADIIVLRHPLDGAAQLAADTIETPVINAGDGTHQHPTQTLVDLFTIRESQNKLDGLAIALVGDLKHGRTVHSLAQALIPFNSRLYFISPPSLEMPKSICDQLREKRVKFSFHQTIEEVLPKLDILYMTRIQQERFSHHEDYERVNKNYHLKKSHLERAKESLKILHPLPRVNEISQSIDKTSHACYFQQAKNGVFVRQALLGLVLGV